MIKNKNRITIFNILSTFALQGLAFVSGPIFSGYLGTNNYGIASTYLTWVQIASIVFTLQAGGALSVAKVNFKKGEQIKYQSSTLFLATIAYLLFSLLTILFSLVTAKVFKLNVLMVSVGLIHGWGWYCVSFINLKFTYEFKASKNFILSVATSVLNIGVSIILIKMFNRENNYWGRIAGQAIVYAVLGIIIFVFIMKKGKTTYNSVYWKFALPITIPTIFHLLASVVLNQSDKLMIKGMISNSAAGIYSLAVTFSAIINAIWHALNNSWVPFYYEYTKQNQTSKIKKHAKNYIELFTIISMGFILLSREVFHFYSNKDYWSGTELIPLFAIGYYFVFLYSFPVNYEFYHKKTKTIAFGTMAAALINLGLNYVMISSFGVIGAVIATVVAHGLQFVFHYYCAKRISSDDFPFSIKSFIPGFVAVCITCVIYFMTLNMWYIRWSIGAVLGLYLIIRIVKRKEIF